jgi:hypothetical protein
MERFFDGMDHENSKTQGENGHIRKIHKNKKERMEGKINKITYMEVPILICFPLVENALKLLPSCDPPSRKPTCMGTSPTT